MDFLSCLLCHHKGTFSVGLCFSPCNLRKGASNRGTHSRLIVRKYKCILDNLCSRFYRVLVKFRLLYKKKIDCIVSLSSGHQFFCVCFTRFLCLPPQETELDILATIQNLLRQCVQPSSFLQPLSKLFSIIHHKLPMQALVSVFQVRPRHRSLGLRHHVTPRRVPTSSPTLTPAALLSDAVRPGAVPHVHH